MFVFLLNYISETFNSLVNLMANDMIELSNEFEEGKNEETEKNEKETEIEDADEYVINSLCFTFYLKSDNNLNFPFIFSELSVFREVDSPPPIG